MPARLVIVLAAILLPASLLAQEPKRPDVKTLDKVVRESLRNVHDKGADLYNEAKDFAGAYRMFQARLLHGPAASGPSPRRATDDR